MGEISDALRRARAEREATGRGDAGPPARPLAELPRSAPPAAPPATGETAEISSTRSGFWQARAMESSPPGAVTERYRHLALRVRRELERRGCHTLLVTSALRQEGKTVTSCNLAMALASISSGRRVVLVDLDLRRPSVARGLGLRPEVGIDTVLRGQASLAEACHPTSVANLDVLPAVSPMAHAHELLSSEPFARLVAELAQRYALVVADTPPVLLVPDVPLAMPHFGACLFVVRAGHTSRSNLEEALAHLPREQMLGLAVDEDQLPSHGGQYGYYMRADELEEDADEDDDEPERAAGEAVVSEETDEFESSGLPPFLRDPLGMVRRRWRWMAAASGLGVLGTLGLVFAIEPTYEAEATVLVESQQIPEDFVRPTVEEDSLQRIDAMVGRVLTHDRLTGLIEKHDLYPELHGVAASAELVTSLRQAIRIEAALGAAGPVRDSARIFSVRFEARSPEVAAAVTNEIAGLLPTESVRSRTKQAKLTTEFLRKELERADSELRAQNTLIREFKEQYRGELPAELQTNLGRLERLQEQRQSLALQIAEGSNRVATLAQAEGSTTGPNARLETLRADLARELSTKTERHPTVLALKQEIALVEAELAANPAAPSSNPTAALVAAERGTLAELRSQLAQTEADLRELDSQVARMPARQEELAALEEKASVLRETYTEFLRKVQEAELAQSLEAAQHGERVSVLNWAGVPSQPQRTRWKYMAAGLVAALGLGLGVGIVLETFDPVLVSARQVESAAGLPVLGSIPRIA